MSADSGVIKFGTDGWRAVIADGFTFANLERVAQAYAEYLMGRNKPENRQIRAVIGYDRRFLSDQFALRAAEVLYGNNVRVSLFREPVPTPLVSWAVKELRADGGVVITASHNPPHFNGFKIKAHWGGSASGEITAVVESLLDYRAPQVRHLDSHNDAELAAVETNYRSQLCSYVDIARLKSAAHSVVVDAMHGSAGDWIERLLTGGALHIETIRGARDALFGGVNPEPIDSNLEPLKKRVTETGSAGSGHDGDADRVGAVNELGETMTMHEVVPLMLLHLAERRGMRGGVVRTISQSVLTKRIAADFNLPLYETPIGFKYIADLMLREDILIGAEESGGIGVKGHIPERDGLLNSLLFLEAVISAGRTPSEMVREMHRRYGEFYWTARCPHRRRARPRIRVHTGSFASARICDAQSCRRGHDGRHQAFVCRRIVAAVSSVRH
ncbi:MAG: hypothetical protein WKF30_16935 [Pyrinomonadaceae bacterium]